MNLPIACNLGALSAEQRAREQKLLADFKAAPFSVQPIEAGYRFRVSADPARLAALVELLGLERLCCPFLTFQLTIGAALAPVFLDVVGEDPAAQAFIRDTFASG